MLKEFRSRARGIGDLLNYAALVGEGIVLLKDGAFLAGWHYAGPDLESASHEELAAQSARLNAALSTLGNGWMLNVDAHRRPASGYPEAGEGNFPDPTTLMIEEERRAQYEERRRHFESVYALTLTYQPPAEAERKLSAFFFEGGKTKRPGWQYVLDYF